MFNSSVLDKIEWWLGFFLILETDGPTSDSGFFSLYRLEQVNTPNFYSLLWRVVGRIK